MPYEDCTTWKTRLPKHKEIQFLEREQKLVDQCWHRPGGCKECDKAEHCIRSWDVHC